MEFVHPGSLIRFNSMENIILSSTLNNSKPMMEFFLASASPTLGLNYLSNFSMDDFDPTDPIKYKTELCRSFQVHGFCKYGVK